jgi:hypothetical protein
VYLTESEEAPENRTMMSLNQQMKEISNGILL